MNKKARKRKKQRQNAKEKKASFQGTPDVRSTTVEEAQGAPYAAGTSTMKFKKRYLTPQDGADFDRLLEEKYQGFAVIPAPQVSPSFHQKAKAAFEKLRDSGYYQVSRLIVQSTW